MSDSRARIVALTALLVLPLAGVEQGAAQPAAGMSEPTAAVPEPAAAVATEVVPPVNVVWVEKDLAFTYMAFTSFYSCDGLRDKVRWVLKEIGARPGYKVLVRACFNATGPEHMPRVEIRAALPMEATPELLAEIAKGETKRELIARATGRSEITTEATAQVPARRRQIRFDPTATSRIQPGDCELMQHLRDHVFVPFGIRMVENELDCVPKQITLNNIRLTIEVLEPVPVPAEAPATAPGTAPAAVPEQTPETPPK
jgi:hypothetical protein